MPPSPAPSSSTSRSPQPETSAALHTYHALKEHSAAFQLYKQTRKRDWVSEKSDLAMLFSNVQTKLKTYGLREYIPPPGLSIGVSYASFQPKNWLVFGTESQKLSQDAEAEWTNLLAAEAQRSRGINAQIRECVENIDLTDTKSGFSDVCLFSLDRVKETLRRKFATVANDFERRVRDVTAEISALDGPLEVGLLSSLASIHGCITADAFM